MLWCRWRYFLPWCDACPWKPEPCGRPVTPSSLTTLWPQLSGWLGKMKWFHPILKSHHDTSSTDTLTESGHEIVPGLKPENRFAADRINDWGPTVSCIKGFRSFFWVNVCFTVTVKQRWNVELWNGCLGDFSASLGDLTIKIYFISLKCVQTGRIKTDRYLMTVQSWIRGFSLSCRSWMTFKKNPLSLMLKASVEAKHDTFSLDLQKHFVPRTSQAAPQQTTETESFNVVTHVSVVTLNERGTREWMDHLTEHTWKNSSSVHRRWEVKADVIKKGNK